MNPMDPKTTFETALQNAQSGKCPLAHYSPSRVMIVTGSILDAAESQPTPPSESEIQAFDELNDCDRFE
jgi:hypothetical protein